MRSFEEGDVILNQGDCPKEAIHKFVCNCYHLHDFVMSFLRNAAGLDSLQWSSGVMAPV